jgi:ATP-dependent Clp protease ATP-binding subunit ClpC
MLSSLMTCLRMVKTKVEFPYLSGDAIKVIVLAKQLAREHHDAFIGSEVILLALLDEGTGITTRVLGQLGVNVDKVRSEIEAIHPAGCRTIHGDIRFSPAAKRTLELSRAEAKASGHNEVRPQHLLLSLIRTDPPRGLPAAVLEDIGVDFDSLRQHVLKLKEG